MILLFKPGTKVLLGKVEVLILEINLSESIIPTYKVCWWDSLDRKEAWIIQEEISMLDSTEYTEIGFKT